MSFVRAKWVRSPLCESANCVEFAFDHDRGDILLRDSKQTNGPVLTFTREEWKAFAAGIKAGAFDVE